MVKSIIFVLLILFGFLQYRLWFGEGGVLEVKALEQKIQQQEADNQKTREKNEALLAEVIQLKEGTEAIEEKARTDLGMIKKGETFYLFVDEDKQ